MKLTEFYEIYKTLLFCFEKAFTQKWIIFSFLGVLFYHANFDKAGRLLLIIAIISLITTIINRKYDKIDAIMLVSTIIVITIMYAATNDLSWSRFITIYCISSVLFMIHHSVWGEIDEYLSQKSKEEKK